jgi:hypothetical protein
MIVQRGLRPPPSFHSERLRQAPIGHFFDVIGNGYDAMANYAVEVAPSTAGPSQRISARCN